MKPILPIAMALAIGLVSSASADYRSSIDDDGCWDGLTSSGNNCVIEDDNYWDDDRFTVVLKNRCSQRVYVRACNERKSGSDDCGAFHIAPGRSYKHYTYKANGTSSWKWIGSVNSSSDWVCAGKVRGWNN